MRFQLTSPPVAASSKRRDAFPRLPRRYYRVPLKWLYVRRWERVIKRGALITGLGIYLQSRKCVCENFDLESAPFSRSAVLSGQSAQPWNDSNCAIYWSAMLRRHVWNPSARWKATRLCNNNPCQLCSAWMINVHAITKAWTRDTMCASCTPPVFAPVSTLFTCVSLA